MKNLYKIVLMVLLGVNLLVAEDGLTQPHLLNSIPTPDTNNVSPNITLSFTFDRMIAEESLKSDTLQLQQKVPDTNTVNGNLSVTEQKTLVFAPQEPLTKGFYTIQVNSFKLQKENISEINPQSTWQKFITWLCGFIYDDVGNCPLCQYVCNVENYILTEPIQLSFEVKNDAPKVISLKSDKSLIELSENNTTQLHITATYDDNSSEDVTQKATYTSSDNSVVVEKGIVSTNIEGTATIYVNYGGETTQIQVEVYEMIEGHLLPHEPENPDNTLLGVDKNNNGVRDEVERWIYKEMPTYHHPKIERVIAMQKAKAYQMALVDPTNQNDEVVNAIHRSSNCWWYFSRTKNLPFDGSVQKFNTKLTDRSFNTKARLRNYLDYDYSLKGRVFTDSLESISDCDTNIDVMP